jgi:hypothetical protein
MKHKLIKQVMQQMERLFLGFRHHLSRGLLVKANGKIVSNY